MRQTQITTIPFVGALGLLMKGQDSILDRLSRKIKMSELQKKKQKKNTKLGTSHIKRRALIL